MLFEDLFAKIFCILYLVVQEFVFQILDKYDNYIMQKVIIEKLKNHQV